MKVIIGGPNTGKSTILLHFVYNEIQKLLEVPTSAAAAEATQGTQIKTKSEMPRLGGNSPPHACLVTSKKRMRESRMLFGIYCEV